MSRNPTNSDAGLGDPFWYEWSIGLRYVLDLLDPDTGVQAVTLQRIGSKGLDDVVVRFTSGRFRFIQVKHTRVDDHLTFGDLVTADDDSGSLLRRMAVAWKSVGYPSEAWLVTNRAAGTRSATSGVERIFRPSLKDFLEWLSTNKKGTKLADFKAPQGWTDAWEKEWLSQLDDLEDDHLKLRFLQALEVEHSEKSLVDVGDELTDRIASLFGVAPKVAIGFKGHLDSALRTWATSVRGASEAITKESVYEKLCLAEDSLVGEHDLVPPAPFFPTRRAVVESIIGLLGQRAEPIIFLVGDPGSGKTAVLSELANQREPTIDIRFHAYRPITPENHLLPADSGRTTTRRALWSDLLIQIRGLASGRLAELQVPVHAGSLTVEQLRGHVLRLANELGKAGGRPFVIAVDGIDHAARAGATTESFLDSLVPPDYVPDNVIFLIGGQPAEGYSKYPVWLRTETSGVRVLKLPHLELADTRRLVDERLPTTPPEEREAVARDILEYSGGHTLSTVFAVEEAASFVDQLDNLSSRLAKVELKSGVGSYYNAIWSSAAQTLPASTAARLAACLTLSPSRATADMVAAVTGQSGSSNGYWLDVLRGLRPLVVEEHQGFRVFHNDVRVFLHRLLQSQPETYQECAFLLGVYLLNGADAMARHAAVQNLFGIAGRPRDQAALFTPSYVLESRAIGEAMDVITEQGRVAAQALALIDSDWNLAHIVATGLRTLAQLRSSLQWRDAEPDQVSRHGPAAARWAERRVPRKGDWTPAVIHAALADMSELHEIGQHDRATAAFVRWFSGLSPLDVAAVSVARSQHEHERQEGARDLLTNLGGVSASARQFLPVSNGPGAEEAEAAYSNGLLRALNESGSDRAFVAVLRRIKCWYVADVQALLVRLVERRTWHRCGLLLQHISPSDEDPWSFRLAMAVLASILGEPRLHAKWTKRVVDARAVSIEASTSVSEIAGEGVDRLTAMSWMALLLGIEEWGREPSAIRVELESSYKQKQRDERQDSRVVQVLYASAVLGSLVRSIRDPVTRPAHIDVTRIADIVRGLIIAIEQQLQYQLPLKYAEISSSLVQAFSDCATHHSPTERAVRDVFLEQVRAQEPLGVFLSTVWRFLARGGHRTDLRRYAEVWVGSAGRAWTEAPAKRHNLVNSIVELLVEIGESGLAESARARLKWADVGYTGHKEVVLGQPLAWFESLSQGDPSAWQAEGLRLLALSREASRTGDNRVSSQVESAVLAAACLDGPTALARLCLVEASGVKPDQKELITALLEMIKNRQLDRQDLLALWAFCTGQLSWEVDVDRGLLVAAREAILAAGARNSVAGLTEAMQQAAPAEYECKLSETDPTPVTAIANYDQLPVSAALDIATASRDWRGVPALINRAKEEGSGILPHCIDLAWGRLRSRDGQPWWYDGAEPAYEALFPLIAPAERWKAVKHAVANNSYRDMSYGTDVISDVLDDLCRLEASLVGEECVRTGLDRLLAMHELWVTGAGSLPPLPRLSVARQSEVQAWRPLLLALLVKLLEFDDQCYVKAALRGIHRLLRVDAALYECVAARMREADLRVQQRFLMISEVLACEHQSEEFRAWLTELVDSSRLDVALSAWSSLLVGQRAVGGEPPPWPSPTTGTRGLIRVGPGLIWRGPSRQGLHQTTGRSSAKILSHLRIACGDELDDVESDFAVSVRDDPPVVRPVRMRRHGWGDLMLSPKVESELDRLFKVLRNHERRGRFASVSVVRLAQALVPSADPFVFLKTPSVHPLSDNWPVDDRLDGGIDSFPVLAEQMGMLLTDDLPDKVRLLGGTVQSFSSKWDVRVSVRYVIRGQLGQDSSPPSVLNPRLSLEFESVHDLIVSHGPTSEIWLTRAVGGLFPFTDAVVNDFPGECWRELRWQPNPGDPLRWKRDGKSVTWFESKRGPVRRIYPHDLPHRQPLLTRWVCTEDEWRRVVETFGEPLRRVFSESAPFGIR